MRIVPIDLDISKFGIQYTVEGVHYNDDMSTELHISLRNKSKCIKISDYGTVVAIMNGVKADGTLISRDCQIVDNKIVYNLDKSDTSCSGLTVYQVTIATNNDIRESILATAKFAVAVAENIYTPIFRLIESKPTDWNANYKSYYRLQGDSYEAVDDTVCPAFAVNTFYKLINPNYSSNDEFKSFYSAMVRLENLIGRASDIYNKLADKVNIDDYINQYEEINNILSTVNADLITKVNKNDIISEFDKLLTDTEKIPTADAIINFLADYYYDINDTYSSDEIDEMINNISVGSAGKSAYQIAVDNGFVGTESEWLATLKGSDGADGTDGAPGADGIGISKIDFNSSTVDGGNNVITITKTDGKSSTFTVKNGTAGTNGNDGVSITAVSQTNTSNADNGNNVITVYLSNGNASTFTVKNGSKGDKGDTGAPGADYVLTTADKQEIANLVNADTDIIPGYVRTAAGNIAEKMIGVTGEFISSSRPAYTNQLFTSTESDGTTIYNNGTGYKTGYRLNSSNAESAQTGFCVTGYIPCTPGDIIRLKNISFNANGASIGSVKIVAYKSDKTVLSSCAVGNMTAVSGVFNDTGNLTQFTTVANCHYFRLSCYDINVDSIITVNEEITTTESTGQDCVPFNFAFLSDIHYSANYKNGIKHTEQALNVISERAHIDLVAFGGDYIPNWTRMTKTNAVAAITDTKINYAGIKTPCLWLKGNHDNNGYTGERLSKAEIYNRIMCKNRDVHGFIENPNDPYGGYGYVDFDNSKIRVIVVNTSDNDNMSAKPNESGAIAPVINAHNVSAIQIQWLADHALDFSSKENAGEWGIIVISHVPIFAASSIGYWTSYTDGDNKSWTLNRQNVADLIKAYVDKSSFTATLNGETATKDFSNLTETAEVICFVNGHGHSERVGTYNGFKFIWCPATAAVASKSDDGNTYTKTADTVNDTAFTMFTVDRANHKIHAWNYGAGYDREIGY